MKEGVVAALVFHDDGSVGGVYTDEALGYLRDLAPDGRVVVERASRVEFDNEQQGWVATVPGNVAARYHPCRCSTGDCPRAKVVLGPFATRAEALDAEVEHLERTI